MKIDIYTNMHNEEKMLPYYFRHYGQFASRFFIWEDESTDRTREMLQADKRVTLLPVIYHGANDFYFIENHFKQYKDHSRGQADWVFMVDADEFIYHPQLLEVLEDNLKLDTGVIQCEGWQLVSDHFPTTDGQIYDEIKCGYWSGNNCKAVVFRPEIDIAWGKGRHTIKATDGRLRSDTGIRLLHCRFLGEKYYKERSHQLYKRTELAFGVGFNKFKVNDFSIMLGKAAPIL